MGAVQYSGTAPTHLQMTEMPPTGSVYAPSQPHHNPFLQGAQEAGMDTNAGLNYAGEKPLEADIPIYTAQVVSQTAPAPEVSARLDAS